MRLLLTGASGQLGGYILRELRAEGIPVVAWSGSQKDDLFGTPLRPVRLEDPDSIVSAFAAAKPTVVIHTGAMTRVMECFRAPQRAHQVNTAGTVALAESAARAGARLLLVSTDLVFDGKKGWYCEQDPVSPLSVYGRTKAAAEQAVLAMPRTVVVRPSLLFGPTVIGRPTFFDDQMAALRAGRPCSLFADEWRTPLSWLTAAQALIRIAVSDVTGILHLGGPERLSRLEMGRRLAAYLGVDASVIVPTSQSSISFGEPRPRDTSLDSSRWRALFGGQSWPLWQEAMEQMMS